MMERLTPFLENTKQKLTLFVDPNLVGKILVRNCPRLLTYENNPNLAPTLPLISSLV